MRDYCPGEDAPLAAYVVIGQLLRLPDPFFAFQVRATCFLRVFRERNIQARSALLGSDSRAQPILGFPHELQKRIISLSLSLSLLKRPWRSKHEDLSILRCSST
jgi:hypothetical protein